MHFLYCTFHADIAPTGGHDGFDAPAGDEAWPVRPRTVGCDACEQVPGLDTVLVAVGGGGLAAGLRLALPSSVRVIAVETEACNAFHSASAARELVDVAPAGVGADARGARRIGELP